MIDRRPLVRPLNGAPRKQIVTFYTIKSHIVDRLRSGPVVRWHIRMRSKSSFSLLQNNLRRLRAERNWSQAVLAEKAGLSVGAIKMFETGKRWPRSDNLDAIASALAIEPWELLKPLDSSETIRTVSAPKASYEGAKLSKSAQILLAYEMADGEQKKRVEAILLAGSK